MLVRFRQDVIGLTPKVVVIHAGTNDLARMLGPGTRGTFADNVMSMTELAKANGIAVVLASLCRSATASIRPRGARRSGSAISTSGSRSMRSDRVVYLDYFTALAKARSFRQELTADGLVPMMPAGYRVMAPLAEAAIAKALKK